MKRTQLNAEQKNLIDMLGVSGATLLHQSFCGDLRYSVYFGAKWKADVSAEAVQKLQKLHALREYGNGWTLTHEALKITR